MPNQLRILMNADGSEARDLTARPAPRMPVWGWVLIAAAAAGGALVLFVGMTLLGVAQELSVSPTVHDIRRLEQPQHRVVITQPLLMGATEVTVGQFRKFVESTGYKTEAEKDGLSMYASPGFRVTDDSPASAISWNDAVVFCIWLSRQEQLEPPYEPHESEQQTIFVPRPKSKLGASGGYEMKTTPADPYKTTVNKWRVLGGNGYRLPTEAQWEYACRAGTTSQYSFGDDHKQLEKFGWYVENSGGTTHPVSMKAANPFGLHDMHGNVWEWCQDFYSEEYYQSSPLNDPQGPTSGDFRVLRGGCFRHTRSVCRSAFREGLNPYANTNVYGFRVVRTLNMPAGDVPPVAVAPFDAGQARQHQLAWARKCGTSFTTTNSIGMKVVLLPPGEFLMGSSAEQVEEAVKAVD
jgi:formylglycine-generating enzyme required for sulfatase activity